MSNQSGPMARRWLLPFALLLITALAAFLRFWQLDRIPPGFHYDEAYEALEAWRVLTQRGYHPIFFPGNFGVEPMFIYLTSLAFRLFGETPTVMRGVAALIGTLTVPALYALGRELTRSDKLMPAALPLFAAFALAIMRWHIFFSRVGIEPILVPFLLTLMLWAYLASPAHEQPRGVDRVRPHGRSGTVYLSGRTTAAGDRAGAWCGNVGVENWGRNRGNKGIRRRGSEHPSGLRLSSAPLLRCSSPASSRSLSSLRWR